MGWGQRAQPICRRPLFIFLAMVCHTIANKINNKRFHPRARSRFENGTDPNQLITGRSPYGLRSLLRIDVHCRSVLVVIHALTHA